MTSFGRNVPSSVSAIERKIKSEKISIIVGRRTPTRENPSDVIRDNLPVSVNSTIATRRMQQDSGAGLYYDFLYPPSQVSHEGIGIETTEIPRPFLRPIVELKNAKNYRAQFEFLVAKQFDGMSQPCEAEIELLQYMANAGVPVKFFNFDAILTSGVWLIAEFSVRSSRVNTDGKITAAQCSIGLIEYDKTETRFVKLPKLTYTSTKASKGGKGDKGGNGKGDGPNTTDTLNALQKEKALQADKALIEKFVGPINPAAVSPGAYTNPASTPNANVAPAKTTGTGNRKTKPSTNNEGRRGRGARNTGTSSTSDTTKPATAPAATTAPVETTTTQTSTPNTNAANAVAKDFTVTITQPPATVGFTYEDFLGPRTGIIKITGSQDS